MGLHEIMCVKLLKTVRHLEFKESFIQLKKSITKNNEDLYIKIKW